MHTVVLQIFYGYKQGPVVYTLCVTKQFPDSLNNV